MSHLLIDDEKGHFYDNLFLGISEPGNDLSRLFAHRFEATFLKRVMGTLSVADQLDYEPVFREFLIYARDENLTMDWKLGLYFLKWAQKINLVDDIKFHSFIASQAAFRWINTPCRDLEYKYILVSDFPQLPHWILGERSMHPLKSSRLFKVNPIKLFSLRGIKYSLLKNVSGNNLNWVSI